MARETGQGPAARRRGRGGADPRVRGAGARCGTTCQPGAIELQSHDARRLIVQRRRRGAAHGAGQPARQRGEVFGADGARHRRRGRRRRRTRSGCACRTAASASRSGSSSASSTASTACSRCGLKAVKGTGLGLYIVRSIARAHGGRVFAHSEGEGRGATFTLELPRFAGEPDALRPAHEPHPHRRRRAAHRRRPALQPRGRRPRGDGRRRRRARAGAAARASGGRSTS